MVAGKKYAGNNEIIRRYVGSALVWEKEEPPTPTPSRTIRINLTSEYGEDAPTTPVIWNDFKAVQGTLGTPGSNILNNLLDEEGNTTTIGVTNLTALNGESNNEGPEYGQPTDGVYHYSIISSSWKFARDRGDTIRLMGLDDTKTYGIYIGSYNLRFEGTTNVFTIGGISKSKDPYGTQGTQGENEWDSDYFTYFPDVKSLSGNIDIGLNIAGLYQGGISSIVIIEQGNSPDPDPDPDPEPSGSVKLDIQMSDTTDATATIPELKYNKQGAIVLDFDDSALCAMDCQTKMSSVSYTDGCGNNVPYTAGVAVNGRFQFDNELVGGAIANARDSITYAQQRQLIDAGWDIMNHSFYHDPDGNQTGDPRWGYGNDPERNVTELDDLINQQTNYQMHSGVVPNADAGFQTEFDNIDYLVGSSQGTFDGYPVWDQYHWPKRFSLLPNDWDFIVQHRDFNTDGLTTGSIMWGRVEDLIDYMNSNPNERCMIAIGTHQLNASEITNFGLWIDNIVSELGDRVMFVGLAQFWEYQRLRRIGKTETIVGNTLQIELDYDSIPNIDKYSWRDLSFIIGGTGTIQNVSCDDLSYTITFNPTTRIVNIKKRQTEWTEQQTFNTSMNKYIGCCGVHEDSDNGFDEGFCGTTRLFSDRAWFEGDIPGDTLRFQNSRSGWYFDDAYQEFIDSGVDIIVAMQKLAIDDPNQVSNKPLDNPTDDPTDPASYTKVADFFKQFAMRYGSVSYPTSELRSDDGFSGLNLVKVIEIDNEPDRDWLGPDAYYEPEEYAALLSACYDAIKEADPNMKVSMGGVASSRNIWYLDRMMAWFKANRPDEKFAADVLAFHMYAFNNSIDWDNPPYPLPMDAESPEDGGFYNRGLEWTTWRDTNAPHCEVYVGEFGWDTNDDSPLRPRHITGTDNYELQARYVVRSLLEFLASGVDKAQIFTIADPGQDYDSTQHATNGLLSRTLGFAPKQSFTAVKNLFDQLDGYNFTKVIRRDTVHVLEFSNGVSTKEIAWLPTATNDSQTINISGNNYTVTEVPTFL